MGDDLGDIMYADDDNHMERLWLEFKTKYFDEPKFLQYFEQEWLTKPGIILFYKPTINLISTLIFCIF